MKGCFPVNYFFGANLRHASEQYFTSSQFFSHDLRQVIVRLHVTQSLLGKAALLPLNESFFIINVFAFN
jgi:hypothetical protein